MQAHHLPKYPAQAVLYLLNGIAKNNLDQPEKAIDWLEKGYELRDPVMTYIGTTMFNFDPLFDNPRFISILEKMKLPLPVKKY